MSPPAASARLHDLARQRAAELRRQAMDDLVDRMARSWRQHLSLPWKGRGLQMPAG